MAVCSTLTGLPLDTWAAILGISPWEFNQCAYPASKAAQCGDVLYQYPWQRDHLSREEVGEAIAAAEFMIAQELLFWPYPHHEVGEVILYPRPHQKDLYGGAGTIRGEWKTLHTRWERIIKPGLFNRTTIGTIAGGNLTKLDEDHDGVFETFQAVITDPAIGTITDPYELALYFDSGDRLGNDLSEVWRIRPVKVSITGNTATFRGHRTLLINPEKETGVNAAKLDATVDANYVTSLICTRTFTDDTATAAQPYQGTAQWKDIPDCFQNCTFSIKELCLGEHDYLSGIVFASFGARIFWPFYDREPDRIEINYLAGLPLVNGQIDPEMAKIITYLSLSLLANEKCGCDRSNKIIDRWRKPITRFEDSNGAGAAAFTANSTPFPMTVGGQYAWSRVKRLRNMEIISL